MITKILTMLQQKRHDCLFWGILLYEGSLNSWINNIIVRPRGIRGRFSIDSTSLYPVDYITKDPIGLGENIHLADEVAILDDVWAQCQLARPDHSSRHPFKDWEDKVAGVHLFSTVTVAQAVNLAFLLFGLKPAKLEGRNALIDVINGGVATADIRTSYVCFVYNVLYGIETDTLFEPSYQDRYFWDGMTNSCSATNAVSGLCHIAAASPKRWSMVEDSLKTLVLQIESEAWQASLYSFREAARSEAASAKLSVDILTLARCILLGSPALASYYDVMETALKLILPFETPEEYLEYARGDRTTRRIESAGANSILKKATQAYPTPLTQGALPAIAVFDIKYSEADKKVVAHYHNFFELNDLTSTSLVVLDLRLMLRGDHVRIPLRNLPECLILALTSLSISADLNQNAVALTTNAVVAITTIWPNLSGHFAQRRLEATYGARGHWWMKDRAPMANEMGNIGWLFDNNGVCMAPRALIGANINAFACCPDVYEVDGVVLEKQTNSQAQTTYRRR